MQIVRRVVLALLGVILTGMGCAFLLGAMLDPSPGLPPPLAVVIGIGLVGSSFLLYRSSTRV